MQSTPADRRKCASNPAARRCLSEVADDPPPASERENPNIASLRALAALSVAIFHFARPGYFHADGLIGWIIVHFHLRMECFFVISGLLIPLVLERMNKRPGAFIVRRGMRLYPPFVICCILIVALNVISSLSPGYRGTWQPADIPLYINNLLLACDLLNTPWLSAAFWTLAIEAQFYLLIVLCFPLLFSPRPAVRTALLAGCILLPALSPWMPRGTLLPHLSVYACGLCLFLEQTQRLSSRTTLVMIVAALAMTYHVLGLFSLLTVVFSLIWIRLMPALRLPLLAWVAGISYSLYLLHIPIGGRVINLLDRWLESELASLAGLVGALGVSLGAAWLFNRYVEQPIHERAKRLGAGTNGSKAEPLPPGA